QFTAVRPRLMSSSAPHERFNRDAALTAANRVEVSDLTKNSEHFILRNFSAMSTEVVAVGRRASGECIRGSFRGCVHSDVYHQYLPGGSPEPLPSAGPSDRLGAACGPGARLRQRTDSLALSGHRERAPAKRETCGQGGRGAVARARSALLVDRLVEGFDERA